MTLQSTTFLDRVRSIIGKHQMLSANERVLVALSGGPDSVALLAALAMLAAELRIHVFAAHLNHGLREAESLRDEQFAGEIAARLGVPCTVQRISLSLAEANLEERAREARYAFLEQVARERQCTKIATGHTRDDQAETVLMRIARGAGLDGMAGIRAVRGGRIIRPLLDCSKPEVLAFLESRGLTYCEDSSNRDRRFLRNRIRHEVLPLLEAMNPGVGERLASAASFAAAEASYLDAHLVPHLMCAIGLSDGSLSLQGLADVPAGLHGRFIRLWLRQVRGHLRRLSAVHIESILRVAAGARPNARVQLPGGEAVLREYGSLRLLAAQAAAGFSACSLALGEAVVLPTGWQIRAAVGEPGGVVEDPTLLSFVADAEQLAAPFVVRPMVPGDRVRPFGMLGHKKLQDLFVDRKVPQRIRQSTPVVEAGGEIIWVPGVVRASAAPVTAATRRTLCLAAAHVGIAGA